VIAPHSLLLGPAFGSAAREWFRIESEATASMLTASALSPVALVGGVGVALVGTF